MKRLLLISVLLSSLAVAQDTIFDNDGGAGDGQITTLANWDNGLPVGQTGGLSINASHVINTALDGYDITQTAGQLSATGGGGDFRVGTGTFFMNGSGASITGYRGMSIDTGTFRLDDGTTNVSVNNRDVFIGSGSLEINGGQFLAGRTINTTGGGDVTVTAGVVTGSNPTTSRLGGSNNGNGTFNLNGGTITFGVMQFGTTNIDFSFGGTTSGMLTIDNFGGFRHRPNNIDIDFLSGSLMTMDVLNPLESGGAGDNQVGWWNTGDETGETWAEALWNRGDLTFAGDTVSGSGTSTIVSWSDATNSSVGLGTGEYFVFDGNALSLAVIPEPSSVALIGLAGVALFATARKRRS